MDSGSANVSALAVDTNGDVVVLGAFTGSVDLGTGPLTGGQSSFVFVAKYDCTGAALWTKAFYGSPSFGDVGNAVAIDAQHEIVLTGSYNGGVDFGCGMLPGTGGFAAKLDASGTCVWSRPFVSMGGNVNFGQRIAVDPGGNVLVAGTFLGTTDFGGGPVASKNNTYSLFLWQIGAQGAFGWLKQFGFISSDFGFARDASGDLLFCGGANAGTPDFGSGSLPEAPVYVAKLDAMGGLVWAKSLGKLGSPSDGASCFSLTTDAAGDVMLGGSYFGPSTDLGGGALPAVANNQFGGFVAKYTASGDYVFSDGNGGAGRTMVNGIAAAASGGLAFTGGFANETLSFGGPGVTYSATDTEGFVAQLDAAGAFGWAKGYGTGLVSFNAVAVAPSGAVVVGGSYTSGTLDFGNGPLPATTGNSAFLAQIVP